VAYLEFRKGARSGGLEDGSPPERSRGGAPVGVLEDEIPQKLWHILCLLTSENSEICINSRTFRWLTSARGAKCLPLNTLLDMIMLLRR